jgi:hypothetical protein
MRLEPEHFAMFVPADPPRAGALAVWGDGQGPDEIELVLPAGWGVRRRRARGWLLLGRHHAAGERWASAR